MTGLVDDAGALLLEGWILLPVLILGGLMCWAVGFRMGRRYQGRLHVTGAVERSVAETVPIPGQREAAE